MCYLHRNTISESRSQRTTKSVQGNMLPVREDSRKDWSARSLSLEDHRSCALSALSDHIPISVFERNSTNTALKKKKDTSWAD